MHNILGFSLLFEMWIGTEIRHQTAADHINQGRVTLNVLPSKACYSTVWVCPYHDFIYAFTVLLGIKHTSAQKKEVTAQENYTLVSRLSRKLWQKSVIKSLRMLKTQPWEYLQVWHQVLLLIQSWFLVNLITRILNYGLSEGAGGQQDHTNGLQVLQNPIRNSIQHPPSCWSQGCSVVLQETLWGKNSHNQYKNNGGSQKGEVGPAKQP